MKTINNKIRSLNIERPERMKVYDFTVRDKRDMYDIAEREAKRYCRSYMEFEEFVKCKLNFLKENNMKKDEIDYLEKVAINITLNNLFVNAEDSANKYNFETIELLRSQVEDIVKEYGLESQGILENFDKRTGGI